MTLHGTCEQCKHAISSEMSLFQQLHGHGTVRVTCEQCSHTGEYEAWPDACRPERLAPAGDSDSECSRLNDWLGG